MSRSAVFLFIEKNIEGRPNKSMGRERMDFEEEKLITMYLERNEQAC